MLTLHLKLLLTYEQLVPELIPSRSLDLFVEPHRTTLLAVTNPGAGGTSMNESAYIAAEQARDLARQNVTATEQAAAHGLSGDSDAREESAEWASRQAEARAGVPFFAAAQPLSVSHSDKTPELRISGLHSCCI